jgi:hypothetical protein
MPERGRRQARKILKADVQAHPDLRGDCQIAAFYCAGPPISGLRLDGAL